MATRTSRPPRSLTTSRRPRRLLATAGAGALAALVASAGGPALAAWTQQATGDGAVAATTLVRPMLTATRSKTSPTSAVDLTWTTPAQPPGATYRVTRTDTRTGASTTLGCTTSPCTASGLASGTTYSFVVSALLGSQWTRASDAAIASTQVAPATSYQVAVSGTPTAGSATSLTITALSPDGGADPAYTGTRTITLSGTAAGASPSGAAATLPTTAQFVEGVATVTPTLVRTGTALGLTATSGGLTGSTTTSVNPGAPARLAFNRVTANGTPQSCLWTCGPLVLGAGGWVETYAAVTDAWGNGVRDLGAPLTVTATATKTNGTSASGALTGTNPLVVPASGPAVSAGSVRLSEGAGSYDDVLRLSTSGGAAVSVQIRNK